MIDIVDTSPQYSVCLSTTGPLQPQLHHPRAPSSREAEDSSQKLGAKRANYLPAVIRVGDELAYILLSKGNFNFASAPSILCHYVSASHWMTSRVSLCGVGEVDPHDV